MNNKFARARVPSSSKRNNNNIHYNNHNNNKQETKFLVLFAFDDYFMESKKKKKLHSLLKKKLFIEDVLFVFIIACNDFFFPLSYLLINKYSYIKRNLLTNQKKSKVNEIQRDYY